MLSTRALLVGLFSLCALVFAMLKCSNPTLEVPRAGSQLSSSSTQNAFRGVQLESSNQPFNAELQQKPFEWQINSGQREPGFSGCVLTASSANHFAESLCGLQSLAFSSIKRIIYIDMGLSEGQRQDARAMINVAACSKGVSTPDIIFHNPKNYMPEHAYVFKSKHTGFKPIAIRKLIEDGLLQNCSRVWYIDSSIRFHRNPFEVEVAPVSGMRGVSLRVHSNVLFTHPGMYPYFNVSRAADRIVQMQGGSILFDPASPPFLRVLNSWKKCCQDFNCIMPPGSSRDSHPTVIEGVPFQAHRDDQSALNLAIWSELGIEAHYQTAFDENPTSWNGSYFLTVERGQTQCSFLSKLGEAKAALQAPIKLFNEWCQKQKHMK